MLRTTHASHAFIVMVPRLARAPWAGHNRATLVFLKKTG